MVAIFLVLFLFAPVTFAYFIIFATISKRSKDKDYFIPGKATRIVKFDLNNRKFYFTKSPMNIKKIFKSTKEEGWNDLKPFLLHFPHQYQKKAFETIHNLEKGSSSEVLKFSIPNFIYESSTTFFVISFDQIDDTRDFFVCFQYFTRNKRVKKPKDFAKIINKEDIAVTDKLQYKGFVAFNISYPLEDNYRKMEQLLMEVLGFSNIEIFYRNSLLFIFVSGRSANHIRRKIKRIVQAIQKKGYKKGIKQFYNGSATSFSDKINSMRGVNRMIQTLTFLLSLSVVRNEAFVSHETDFNSKQFRSFADALKLFRIAIDNHALEQKIVPIRGWLSNRRIVDYLLPSIPEIEKSLFDAIVKNNINERKLIDGFANQIVLDKKIKGPILLDVNADWLIKYHDNIKYRNAIYVIKFDYGVDTTNLKKMMQQMEQNKFILGLRVSDFNEIIRIVIQVGCPKFIVIDQSMWPVDSVIDSNTYMKMLSIRNLAHQKNIKLIYENPSIAIDKERAKQIGLKYYYRRN